MRWEGLFADLESQWQAQERRELDAEVADRTRRERATIGLGDRLAAHHGRIVGLALVDGTVVRGAVREVGRGWLLLAGLNGSCLVPTPAVTGVEGLERRASLAGGVSRSFGFGYALRGLSRDRAVVTVGDVSGGAVTGTIDAVGLDFVEVTEHPADVPRRPENVTGSRAIPFGAIVLVRPASPR